MSGFIQKTISSPVTLLVDWRRGYLAPGESVCRDLGWTIRPNGPADPPLFVVEQSHDDSTSWATFECGASGCFYIITNRIKTTDERVLGRALIMRVTPNERPQ
jgi:hypothetical protein